MIIETDNLRKRFGRLEALQGLTLSVPTGSAFALIGANGAGKSTTIKLLMNILEPTTGSAQVLGVDTRALSPVQLTQIGYVSENQEMPGRMTVGAYIAYLRPFYPSWDRRLEADLLDRFGLPLDRKIKDLSHGTRLKMALACALPFRPKLLVLDEPFSGLDPLTRDDLLDGLMRRERDTTVLISSHELAEIEDLTSHVAFIDGGQLVFQEAISDLKARLREVRVSLARNAELPARFPSSWLAVSTLDGVLSFVDTQFSEPGLAARVTEALGDMVVSIETRSIPLRSIYTTLARATRKGEAEA